MSLASSCLARAVDHEKNEMYVRFLIFNEASKDREASEDREVCEDCERGPYPASTVWVPTYQTGVANGGKLVDDGKRPWLPHGVDVDSFLPANVDSFRALERCGIPLVRSGGPLNAVIKFVGCRMAAPWGHPVEKTLAVGVTPVSLPEGQECPTP